MYALAFQKVIIEAILDLFYFPIWWYSVGMLHFGRWCNGFFLGGYEIFAPGVWLRNIFVPMYGQYDIQGRLISFFMRVVQIIFRSAAALVWLAVSLVIFIGYLVLPLLIGYGFMNIYSGNKLWNL